MRVQENMNMGLGNNTLSTDTVLEVITRAACDAKGRDLVVLDVDNVFSLAKYFVIVSGRSDRQVQGIANRILDSLAENNIDPISVEGVEQGHWALLDVGDVLVHIFFHETREQFDLESLWARATHVEVGPEGELVTPTQITHSESSERGTSHSLTRRVEQESPSPSRTGPQTREAA